jgi:PAS domain S-box-containing protein
MVMLMLVAKSLSKAQLLQEVTRLQQRLTQVEQERDALRRSVEANERALQSREAQLHAILEKAIDGLMTLDEHGQIGSCNPAAERLFGYTATEMIGQNLTMLILSPDGEDGDRNPGRCREMDQARMIGGRQGEVVGQCKDGTTFPLELVIRGVRIGNRRIFTAMFRDLTEQRRAQHDLQRAARLALVGQLTAGIAHEIGTPLNVISGSAETLYQELAELGLSTDIVVAILEQTDRITGLIRQLLDFARAKQQPMASLALQEPLQSALRLLAIHFRHDAITPVVEIPADLPLVWGSADQVQQVFLNLLINAWHAMPNGGTITIQAQELDDTSVQITLRDTGIGMSSADLERAFEPFFSTKGEGGTGLGLMICQQIMAQHHGTIDLDSSPGNGTTITLNWPWGQV